MARIYTKCRKCEYKEYPCLAFPCRDCKRDEQIPLTCRHCLYFDRGGEEDAPCHRNKRNLKPCDKFFWD